MVISSPLRLNLWLALIPSLRKAWFCRMDSLNFSLRCSYSLSSRKLSTFEKGAGSPSNNLVLVSHWYFELASNTLVVEGCTMKALAITCFGTINGTPVWRVSLCCCCTATAQSWRQTNRQVQQICWLLNTRCRRKVTAMLDCLSSWASDTQNLTRPDLWKTFSKTEETLGPRLKR